MRSVVALAAALFLALAVTPNLHAQVSDDTMSAKEIDSLRDAAYIPNDRIAAFERILNTREEEIKDLLAQPPRASYAQDMHDAIEQLGSIADEFNDNLDEYSANHRDVRKALPKLLKDIDRWSTTVRAPSDNEAYNIVRHMALDSLKDMHDIATSMQIDQAAYFKAHPDAAKREKDLANPEHLPVPAASPR